MPPGAPPPPPPPPGGCRQVVIRLLVVDIPLSRRRHAARGGRSPFKVGDAFRLRLEEVHGEHRTGPDRDKLVFMLIGAVIYGLQFLFQSITSPRPPSSLGRKKRGPAVGRWLLATIVSLLFSIVGCIWSYLVQAGFRPWRPGADRGPPAGTR